MAGYRDYLDRGVAAVDRVFSEKVQFKPMRSGLADGSRQALELVGPLRTGDKAAASWLTRDQGEGVQVAGAVGVLALSKAEYAGLIFKKGDAIRAIEREGMPWFEVLYADPRGHSRLIIYLGDA